MNENMSACSIVMQSLYNIDTDIIKAPNFHCLYNTWGTCSVLQYYSTVLHCIVLRVDTIHEVLFLMTFKIIYYFFMKSLREDCGVSVCVVG